MIELDGSFGEGGGQILRSALSLSTCTGTPFRIAKIRANRRKPGLMRQHLTAVNAAAEISGARLEGAHIGSEALTFVPGTVRGGDYEFSIGSAGSCTLVLQTVLPALLQADKPSRVVLQGGTHNPMCPPFHFLQRSFVPALIGMGADVRLTLDRFGFYPAGGGRIVAEISPVKKLAPLTLVERGERTGGYAECFVAGVPAHVAKRELACIGDGLNWGEDQLRIRQLDNGQGPGNALLVSLEFANITEVVCGFGERGIAAETVARQVLQSAKEYLSRDAVAGEHLADQLLLPLALSGEGMFTATMLSSHAKTNMEVIAKFLPVKFTTAKFGRDWIIQV